MKVGVGGVQKGLDQGLGLSKGLDGGGGVNPVLSLRFFPKRNCVFSSYCWEWGLEEYQFIAVGAWGEWFWGGVWLAGLRQPVLFRPRLLRVGLPCSAPVLEHDLQKVWSFRVILLQLRIKIGSKVLKHLNFIEGFFYIRILTEFNCLLFNFLSLMYF